MAHMGQGPYGPGPIWARAHMGQGPCGPGHIWARAHVGQGPYGPRALGPGPFLVGRTPHQKTHLKKSLNYVFLKDLNDMKKMRDVRTIILAVVSRRDLCYVSENEGFRFYDRGPFMEKFPWSPPLYNFIRGYKIDMAI